jgi:hypothetical protein
MLQRRLEGIVSKRKDSAYSSGRSPDRLKMKNSAAPAVKREEEEECGKRNGGNYRQEPDHDLGPTTDGTYIVEFRTAEGEALAISIPRSEAAVLRHFQERMPYGLFLPDAP